MSLHQFLDQFLAAIYPYVVAFSAAILGIGTLAIYNWGRVRGLQVQVNQLTGAGAAPTVNVTVPTAQPAAGLPMLPAPTWNQLNDPLPDGAQDPYASSDCGEESVAMVVAACGGPSLPAGVYRQLLGGSNRTGETNSNDLVTLLQKFHIPAHVRQVDFETSWIEWGHSYSDKRLVIALGYWVTNGFRHWMLIREIDDSSVTFNDPWGGVVRRMTKGWAQLHYDGTYVHVDQPVQPTVLPT